MSDDAPRRGRPRDDRTHKAILEAANRLLAERGHGGFAIEAVAALAGVSKASIYRRWPSRGALLLDLYMAGLDGSALADDAALPLRTAFQAYLDLSVDRVARPEWAQTLKALVAEAQGDRAMAAMLRERVIAPRRAAGRRLLERGIRDGTIDPATDPDIVLDAVFGALWYRLLLGHLPVDRAFALTLVDQLFRWVAPSQAAPPPNPPPRGGEGF